MKQMLRIGNRVGARPLAAAAAALAALAVVAATPGLLDRRLDAALAALGSADIRWLWLAGAGFVLSLLGSAGSWRCAIGLSGGRLGMVDAAARFGAGSLVNTFVPARAGDAVRLALFSRALDGDRLWRAGGAFAALGAARAVVTAAVVVAGVAAGALPLWPVLLLLGAGGAGVAVALAARGRTPGGRVSRLLDPFRTLGSDPRAAARLLGWVLVATAPRVVSAAAVGAALGIPKPLAAALVIVPALDVAGLFPLTPGNVGITSGTVAVAFAAHGIPFGAGLAAGIAFHAVETAVGISVGLGSVAWLAPYPSPGVRRAALRVAAAGASFVLACALGATVLLPLV